MAAVTVSAEGAAQAGEGAAMGATLFDLAQVGFCVSGRQVLEPLTLRLPAGRMVGLIGQNGSGKSTLLKLLARQQRPTSGTIWFAGRDLLQWRSRAFARRLGYLPQHPPPAPGLLVRELVGLGRYPWHGALGRFGPADRGAVEEAMASTDVLPLAERMVDSLSGGERQRAWIAMLLAQRADCLLLDEPISALDLAHQMEVLMLARSLSAKEGISVLVVLHDVNMAARFCDDLIALRAGRLIAHGHPTSIVTSDGLEAIYGLPMEVLARADGIPLSYPK